MSYYRLVISRAFAERRSFWNLHRVVAYGSVPISGLVLRWLIKGGSQVSGWQEVALFVVFGLMFSWALTFCVNLIRVPRMLHFELAEENLRLQAMAYPIIPPEEHRRREFVRNALKEYGVEGRRIIQFVVDTGITNPQAMIYAGLAANELAYTLNRAMMDGLLELDQSVKAELVSAIRFVLDHWQGTEPGCTPSNG